MNYNTKYRVKLLASLLLFFASSIDAKKTTTALSQDVSVSAFDTANGIWYLGTAVANGDSSLVKTNAVFDGSTTPTLTALAGHADLTASIIDKKLALSYLPSTSTAVLALHDGTDLVNSLKVGLLLPESATSPVPTFTPLAIRDQNDNAITAAAELLNFALSPTGLVVAVKNVGGNWGEAGAGIRFYTYTTGLAITERNCPEFSGAEAWIAGGNETPVVTQAVTPSVIYHPGVDRFYVGIGGTSTGAGGNDSITTLSCWYDNANTLTNVPITTDIDGFDTGLAAATSSIVGAKETTDADRVFTILNLAPMTTSTGKHYIIVNGGLGAANAVCAKVFALPLCDTGTATQIGALAKVGDTTNGAVNFSIPSNSATGADLYNENSVPAIVGGAALPTLVTTAINQITVVGDTVYCAFAGASTAGAVGTGINPGIVYSQAIFDHTGTIVAWTDWAKAAPNTLTGIDATEGACYQFAVDAARGRIWTVGNVAGATGRRLVNVNQWTRPTALTTPGGQVNSKLTGGCYSMLLLGQHVRNLGNVITNRFTLFGGDNQVVAIKSSINTANTFTGADLATPNWTATTVAAVNLTNGLENVGPVTALGWTGQNATNNDNYLLAGTNKGLYAFASNVADGAGFDSDAANVFADLDHAASIWQTYKWHALSAITEPVTKIVTVQHATNESSVTFVLTHGVTDKIWRVGDDSENDVISELNATIAAIATTGLAGDDFANISRIYDIELVSQNGLTGTLYELVASTNLGLFKTTVAPITNVTTAATANWTQITDTTHKGSLLRTPLRCRQKQTLWTIDAFHDGSTGGQVVNTKLNQLGFNANSTQQGYTPSANNFNANSMTYFNTLNRVTAFSSVGALRFMSNRVVPHSNTDYSLLGILPYQVAQNQTNLTAMIPIPDAVCLSTNTKAIYWVGEVGAGYIMAGTDDGVIELS
ncbi:MAG: hypothetical protein LVQ75_00155 [Candidatus Babeliales bacterium]|jgi:hypothetical protein